MKLRSPLPELEGVTTWLNGKVNRRDLVGEKPTLIHFWSVSCEICKEAMEEFNQFCAQYNEKLNVVSVHMPRSEEDTNIEKIKKVAQEFHITQPIFVDNSLALADQFENQYVPSYYVFDHTGVLRHYQAGGSGLKMLEKRVNRILEEIK